MKNRSLEKPKKLTEARARALSRPAKGQHFVFCSEVKGFGVRCTPGSKSYVVQLRDHNGKKVRLTLGPVAGTPFVGPKDAPGARDLAIVALAAARRGEDPSEAIGRRRQPAGITLADVWHAYQEAGSPKRKAGQFKRASSIATDKRRYARHLKPKLGSKPISEITTGAVQRWLDGIKNAPGQQTQCLLLLKCLLRFASQRKLGVVNKIELTTAPSKELQTFLKPAELRKLDAACVALAAEQPARAAGFAALRVLVATGCRLGEVLALEWSLVDLAAGTARLRRDKASDNGREVLLSPAAVAALAGLPRTSSPYVFPGSGKTGHMVALNNHADAAFARADLPRARIHDLRHSFASTAVGRGVSLYVVSKLLVHKNVSTTQRYSHLESSVQRAALNRVATAIKGGESIGDGRRHAAREESQTGMMPRHNRSNVV